LKAIVCTGYGAPDVLQLRKVEQPVPRDNELLVRVRAASVTTADSMMRKGTPAYARLFLGLRKPKKPVPGTGFAGDIEATGREVRQFRTGDQVFGETGVNFGAHAEFVCVQEDGLVARKPDHVSYEEAATICDGALTGYNFLSAMVKVQEGHRVLVNGASGSLGTSAVQLAKYLGANVTAVCSTKNLEWVKSLGADRVIDYTEEDFTRTGDTYDIIYDTVGKSSFRQCKRSLTQHGVYLSPVLSLPLLFRMLLTSLTGGKKAKFSATGLKPVPELRNLLAKVTELVEGGKIQLVIDKRYDLEQIVDAHRYVDTGHKKGNVIITLNGNARN
jgi:NADPH:quinone reductase-like Zn-dependent oxidoreductase